MTHSKPRSAGREVRRSILAGVAAAETVNSATNSGPQLIPCWHTDRGGIDVMRTGHGRLANLPQDWDLF